MNYYQAPKAKLEHEESKSSLLSIINKALLFIEFLFIILPTALLLISFSFVGIQGMSNHSLLALFILLLFLSFLAMLSLSLLIINFVFEGNWLAKWWRNLPYFGVLCVFIGFITQQISDKQKENIDPSLTYIEMFVVGFVLFIPLAHFQLSQHLSKRAAHPKTMHE